MVLHTFSYVNFSSVYFLFEMSVQVFGQFFNWIVYFPIVDLLELFVLDNSPLSDMSFAIIFSQFVSCLSP